MRPKYKSAVTFTVTGDKTKNVDAVDVIEAPIAPEARSVDGIRDYAKLRIRPVGHCIYCGATDALRREHVVPLGLCPQRSTVLPAASCGLCAKITGDFERLVLRGTLRPIRARLGLSSRSK